MAVVAVIVQTIVVGANRTVAADLELATGRESEESS